MIQTPADLLEAIARAKALSDHLDLFGAQENPGVAALIEKTVADIEAFALSASAGE